MTVVVGRGGAIQLWIFVDGDTLRIVYNLVMSHFQKFQYCLRRKRPNKLEKLKKEERIYTTLTCKQKFVAKNY